MRAASTKTKAALAAAPVLAACALLAVSAALVAGCGLDAASALSAAASSPPASPSPSVSPTATPTPTPPPSPSATPAPTPSPSPTPVFRSKVEPIPDTLRERMISVGSWRPGCPVPVRDLRLLTVKYWGFDDTTHRGRLVVARGVSWKVVSVFHRLFDKRFHIRRMRLIEYYGASDRRSMAADNTSAFNGRYVAGTTRWSMHAYGIAIDINPVENPYVSGSHVSPPQGRAYADRSRHRRGMIVADGKVVRAFAAIGWEWGGYWRPARDYQHFSANGR